MYVTLTQPENWQIHTNAMLDTVEMTVKNPASDLPWYWRLSPSEAMQLAQQLEEAAHTVIDRKIAV